MPPQKEKRHVCTIAGCGKIFTRNEHLQRHLLNHTDSDFTCERCRAHFKRQDLLERHLVRHNAKDAEGSSLMTRKRSWKDANGDIVTQRPKPNNVRSVGELPEDSDFAFMSPPTSMKSCNGNPTVQDMTAAQEDVDFSLPTLELTRFAGPDLPSSDMFWDTPLHAAQSLQSKNTMYEDIFNPDTANSFNMPFTTMNNYNWLFDLDFNVLQQSKQICGLDGAPPAPMESSYPSHSMPESSKATAASPGRVMPTLAFDRAAQHDRPLPSHQDAFHSSPRSRGSVNASKTVTTKRQKTELGKMNIQSQPERPLALVCHESILPRIDQVARSQVLDLIRTSCPVTPAGTAVSVEDPLLSMLCLQRYCDLYFTKFNTAYPLIHQATFEPATTDTLLLTAMLSLGATYAEKDAHQLAVCIHDVLRPRIFAHTAFSARPTLWMLQTILLVECFGKSRAGQRQHDMSHLFHGLLINLIRRSDCQVVNPEVHSSTQDDLEDQWRAWADAEQKKRLAQLCFLWDVQHAVLFCQSLCMSAFELRCTLPCDQIVWEAPSAQQWARMRDERKSPPLSLAVLKSYLAGHMSPMSIGLNALSRVIILHGLMSISWDMGRRDATSLGIIGNDLLLGNWKDRLADAYAAWKADFDAYGTIMKIELERAPAGATEQEQARRELTVFDSAYTAIYHSACIMLYADFLDMQIYAGARHILGRAVGRQDYSRSQKVVKQWATSAAAAKATLHAAHLLKHVVSQEGDFDANSLFHYPWCLYIATATIWCFSNARPSVRSASESGDENEPIWDAKAEMDDLISSMTSMTAEELAAPATNSERRGVIGLTAVISNHLQRVRWAVVHSAMTVLKGLVPWRLISQDNALV
ncbi:hypothetical protein EJ03DRAFT_316261 [Teratosphaeria nubilosa]|uniref:C2H2-type domain-containing protein n=1 Tax=Teratosphaeria nubilosa TaxID=161662 RepID=A0A6G1L2G3_9PEZI|nr:hypothetical protein EJ03DRAFT_316261 [Teratosphaeria nubilosa]